MQSDFPDHEQTPAARPVRSRSILPWVLILVTMALIGASFVIPMPSQLLFSPGPIRDVEQLIEVQGRDTFSSEGSLYLTTVSVDESITVAQWVSSFFDPTTVAVDEQSFTNGLSINELNRIQKLEMTASKRAAAFVALRELGVNERPGVEIASVLDEPAKGELNAGDVISSIDGEAIGTTCDLLITLSDFRPGETVELGVTGDSGKQTIDLELGHNPDQPERPFIGIEMGSDDFGPIEYEFKTGRIAGPSAGLMFALAFYDRLTPEDLTAGRRIAGTGTISCDGSVGAIGGVEQKVAAAEAEGAEIFLSPTANAGAARGVANDIEVVAVDNFDDALSHLENLE